MFTFFGILASIFAGIRLAKRWDNDWSSVVGILVVVHGIGATVAFDVGPLIAIGATIWIYRYTETSGDGQFDDFDQTSLPDPDEMSHSGADPSVSADGDEAAGGFFDEQARTGGVTPDTEPDDIWQRGTAPETSDTDAAGDLDRGTGASSPSTPTEADEGDDGSTDDHDPYDVEW